VCVCVCVTHQHRNTLCHTDIQSNNVLECANVLKGQPLRFASEVVFGSNVRANLKHKLPDPGLNLEGCHRQIFDAHAL